MYTIHQWLLLFYLYCFVGWVWESCYVSALKHKWINRGFLKGPLLPIYGSGAIVVLISTITVKENIFLVFIIGMIAATVLEYITGELMESIFNVRYWDYSNKPFNINGHICLLSSLAWGVFSIILVEVVNPKVANLIIMIPNEISEGIAYLMTIFITIDGVQSFNVAINLKNILIRITERNETIKVIKKRIEVAEAFINNDVKGLQERLINKLDVTQGNKNIKKQSKAQHLEEVLRKNLSITESRIRQLSDKLGAYIDKLENLSYKGVEENESLRREFKEYINKLKKHEGRIKNTENKVYINSINILRRNPNAKTDKYEEAMNEIKELDKDLNDK